MQTSFTSKICIKVDWVLGSMQGHYPKRLLFWPNKLCSCPVIQSQCLRNKWLNVSRVHIDLLLKPAEEFWFWTWSKVTCQIVFPPKSPSCLRNFFDGTIFLECKFISRKSTLVVTSPLLTMTRGKKHNRKAIHETTLKVYLVKPHQVCVEEDSIYWGSCSGLYLCHYGKYRRQSLLHWEPEQTISDTERHCRVTVSAKSPPPMGNLVLWR